jgi:tetratricopeptide (TPR) repeat protein
MRIEKFLAAMVTVWFAVLLIPFGIAAGPGGPSGITASGESANGLVAEKFPEQQSTQAAPSSTSKQCTVSAETAPPVSAALAAAQKLVQAEKLDEALTAYQAIVPAGGTEAAVAYAEMARIDLEKNDPTSAYDAAQKAVALTPDKAPAIVALGEVYFRQGKIPEAQGAFMKPLRACDLDARAFLGLYRVYAISLNWKRAKTNIDSAYKLDPSDPEIAYYHNQTLTIAEKISALQAQLDDSAATTDDKAKEEMKKHLESLQARANEPATCRLTTKVAATETTLEPMSDLGHVRGYGLTVKINGASARLLMDTGAPGISIDQNLAEKAGVKKLYETTTSGIGDEHDVASYIGRAAKIQIGNLEFENCLVDVLKERSIVGEDGLIGADVFGSFLIDISMTKHKMKLTQLPPFPDEAEQVPSLNSNAVETKQWRDRYFPPEMKGYTAMFETGHYLLIPTSVNASPPKLFLIDTGAFDNELSLAAAKEVTKVRTDYDNYGNLKGISGKVKTVYRAAEAVIQFANFKQDRSDLFVIDMSKISHGAGTEISGLLGFQMLFELEMKIDYRDGLIQFSADERYRANNVDVFDSR